MLIIWGASRVPAGFLRLLIDRRHNANCQASPRGDRDRGPRDPLMTASTSSSSALRDVPYLGVLLMRVVSRKINTAKLRKINKCQRRTRSLSHLTIITLIWDMLTNLLSRSLQPKPQSVPAQDRRRHSARPETETGFWTQRMFSAFRCRPKHHRRCRRPACCVKLSN